MPGAAKGTNRLQADIDADLYERFIDAVEEERRTVRAVLEVLLASHLGIDPPPPPQRKGKPRTRPVQEGPKQPVGRPKKDPPEVEQPKRPRGRPRKT